ncbi:MAG TPA: hypothetical protein VNB23_11200 [Ramlibacter sp.]|nr:hypothetical protein [Ramlibacter sp.]
MPNPNPDDQDGLPPPGSRWGAGAQSVLPYLTKSLQAKPASTPEARESRPRDANPVFANWPPRQV